MNIRFEIFVEDVIASLQFYQEVLGFRSGHVSSHYSEVFYGSVEIGICLMAKLPDDHPLKMKTLGERNGLGVEMVLVVDDLDSYYQKVLDTGYPIHAHLQMQPWNLRDFRLLDPDGYYYRITSK